uniref:Bifunctional pinoresinol-lariciresinol reductase 3 n=1 Tax=Thuja plicata TaxID=3316 RepID=PILR3_THUPL|nr:RecName: Full=Bifunctional pinoresinol-lariciresinol reductase 3; Short=PLR-TP3; AltName: Full=(-)-lariciresinol reductase; AltName: Full=(-)-pinoresinol reductase [Thuja plicata]AAF63509.1 pinoresinol-lariciresinol reductase [Thuja plicata]AAF64183.1 phenylcoumaran benzylic ether reductase homolog Tp1 [Thuja plicata]
MDKKSRVLIVGGTGFIGKRIVKASLALGHPTYVLFRPEALSYIDKVQMLISFKQLGAKLLEASLDDHQGLVDVVKQVDVVISAVSGGLVRHHILDQLKLVEAIKEAGNIKRFLPSEFGMDPDVVEDPLEPGNITFIDKRKVRRAIEAATIPYTYVSSNMFAGFFAGSLAQLQDAPRMMPARDKVLIYGDGNVKGVYVDEDDAGIYIVKSIDDPRTLNKTVYIRPPMNILSQKEVVEIWERLSGLSLEKIYVSEDQLLNMKDKSYVEKMARCHLYHFFIKGDLYNFEIGPNATEGTKLYPEVKYTTMDSYMERYL